MKHLLVWMVKMFAVMSTLSQTLVLMWTWFIAFSNGDSVMVYINRHGEMYPELVMWIVCLPLFCYGTWLVMRELWKEGWRRRRLFRKEMTRLTGWKYPVETLR